MASTNPQPEDRSLGNGTHGLIRSRREVVAALPGPDETWQIKDVDEASQGDITVLLRHGIIEVVDEVRVGGSTVKEYRTSAAAKAYVEALDDAATPCGHTGVRCIEPRETYTCGYEGCEARFGPETAREEMRR